MSKITKLFQKVKNNPYNTSFDDLCRLIEYYGFILDRQSGSHRLYYNKMYNIRLNIQPDKNVAKGYQVKQFLTLIDRYKINFEDNL